MRTFRRLLAGLTALALAGIPLPTSAAGRDAGGSRRAEARDIQGSAPSSRPRIAWRSSLSHPSDPSEKPADQRPTSQATAPGSRAPQLISGFDGIGDIGEATPSDTTGALGDSWYLTAVNVSWALFDRAGTPVLGPESLNSIDPSLAGAFSFDPKVVYDQYEDEFILVFLVFDESPRTSLIVISTIPNATADDTSTWCTTFVGGDQLVGDGAQWSDYPGLGYTSDRVTITTNQFSFSDTFRYSQILSFEKSQLYDCSIPSPTFDVLAGTQTANLDGSPAFTLQPAQTVGGPETDQFLLSFELAGKDSFLTIWRVREGTSGLIIKKGTIPTGGTKFAFFAAQGGVPDVFKPDFWWDPGDVRLLNAFYDSDRNRLYAAHTVRKNFGPDIDFEGYVEAAARWYEVEPVDKVKASSLLRKGLIGQSEVEIGWPVVATDASGNLFVTYNRASFTLDEFISAWIAEIPPDSTSPTELLLAPGEAFVDVSSGPERWGDYSAIGRDPLDGDVVFAVNQFAASSNGFQQSIHTVRHI